MRLHLVANNICLLLLGRRPNLGSRLLALCDRRIGADWRARHHNPLLLLETFVDPDRFRGTVCRAANWTPIGKYANAQCSSPALLQLTDSVVSPIEVTREARCC